MCVLSSASASKIKGLADCGRLPRLLIYHDAHCFGRGERKSARGRLGMKTFLYERQARKTFLERSGRGDGSLSGMEGLVGLHLILNQEASIGVRVKPEG